MVNRSRRDRITVVAVRGAALAWVRFTLASMTAWAADAEPLPRGDTIPTLDLSGDTHRQAIVDRVMEGVAIKAGQLLPEGFFGVSPSLKPMDYDPEGAKKLLSAAGVGDGFKLTIHGPNDRYINDAKIAEAVGQMLTRLGIETEVVTMPRSVYFKRASRGGAPSPRRRRRDRFPSAACRSASPARCRAPCGCPRRRR